MIFRICERFPNWVPTPDSYYALPDDVKSQLVGYHTVRCAEEVELAALGI